VLQIWTAAGHMARMDAIFPKVTGTWQAMKNRALCIWPS
jgi:hypothetical protein